MRKIERVSFLLGSTLALGLMSGVVYADISDEAAEADDAAISFSDPDQLATTLMRDDQVDLDAAKADLDAANLAVDQASEEELPDALADQEAAQDAYDAAQADYDEELAAVQAKIAELSDEQLFALNRSLNNAVSSGLLVDLDSAQLAEILDGDFDKRQINALTKAYEEEAKFETLAQKFEDKAALNEHADFLDKAERMRARGAAQKEKFLAKIEDFGDLPEDDDIDDVDTAESAADAVTAEARQEARDAAKEARDIAKEARDEARQVAKDESRELAKEARAEARDLAKEEARELAREMRREARDAAREAARGI